MKSYNKNEAIKMMVDGQAMCQQGDDETHYVFREGGVRQKDNTTKGLFESTGPLGEIWHVFVPRKVKGVTYDGVTVYEDDTRPLWIVEKQNPDSVDKLPVHISICSIGLKDRLVEYFSTEESANAYLEVNKSKVVGTTLDGVDIMEGEERTLYTVSITGSVMRTSHCLWVKDDFDKDLSNMLAHKKGFLSSKEAAEKWKADNLVGVTEDGVCIWVGTKTSLYYIFDSASVNESALIIWAKSHNHKFEADGVCSNYFKSKEKCQAALDEINKNKVILTKGSHMVLYCDSSDFSSFTNQTVYKLREDFTQRCLYVELDDRGSATNGITQAYIAEVNVELATEDQAKAYELAGKPIHIDGVEDILKPKVSFKEGDDVIHPGYGEGYVRNSDNDHGYPVYVMFNTGMKESFTSEGKLLSKDVAPTLVFKPGTKPFKVGQRVRCLIYGDGVIKEATGANYPVRVAFGAKVSRTYKFDGRWNSAANPTLFHIVE